ncbi:5-formyltetrahydrofolate cyclo-ligase [Flavobacterium ovatum]|uniref:5-formyltetrahydrofolate cyclo-ligase n=1 Tax=Flavobacterium ovatum TaxID=1928857 RepID=UPI00344E2B2D
MSQNKKALRTKYKTLRQNLTTEQVEEMSLAIANKLIAFPIWDKTYFHVFLPIMEHNEVDTELILHLLSGKDKEIVISKADFETRGMTHYLLTDNTQIKKNEYNIPEPLDGLEVPSSKIDVVFIPLLAFDQKGNRVGYGKGFYDKFLAECKPETIKIGLSFFAAETVIEDVFESDIALDYCVTPEKVYEF